MTTAPPLEQRPVTALRGVGPKLAAKLAALGITTVQDVLFHLPLRYQDRTRITPIGALVPGQDAVIEGEIRVADVVFGRRRSLVCRIQDGTGTATLRFFHFSAAQRAQLAPGTQLRCYGEARRGASGLEFYHPEYRLGDAAAPVSERLTPVYPSTEGLQQASWRKLCAAALAELDRGALQDLLPEPVPLPDAPMHLADALRYLHAPPREANLAQLAAGAHPCQRRLAFEELVAHQLSLLSLREQLQRHGAPPLTGPSDLIRQFLAQLPFTLTGAQQRVAREVADDLRKPVPMLRLVQGDVGSGKTVIAALAALRAVASGYQVALMAPTELLAEQHCANFRQWLEPLGLRVGWLAGKVKGKEREATLAALHDGSLQIAVGTHALLQERVSFARLGLAIIDEQHRFGVHQRLQLQEKGLAPHQLIMTATPIPRTLAMSAYADLDTSVIDELPPGRQPVQTVVIGSDRRAAVTERIRHVCRQGRQVYWVCTLIEESEQLQAQAAETSWQELSEALPELRVVLLHGRMKAAEKAAVMASFKAGEIDVLVATTVIEVGVDVPNASLMVIENPERLGLAQLHQLRGRVGRGSLESFCVLLYQTPLSRTGRARLQVLRDSNDGFVIAERDLELRGPGEVLGTRQTGLLTMKLADLQRDADLLPLVRSYAQQIAVRHPAVAAALIRRWLPNRERYARV
ncbi:MAG: ATP-dependent DNA helicase RecG [Spongiibacteraceae bacterium]|nr:ATP-dependent DNA helicase RecG [Spongiibacteraceae bacterium]